MTTRHNASESANTDESKPMVCTLNNCGRSFPNVNELAKHVEDTHIKDRTPNDQEEESSSSSEVHKYPCEVAECGMAFESEYRRDQHQRRHTAGEFPAESERCICPFDGCDQVFENATAYGLHYQDVHDPQPQSQDTPDADTGTTGVPVDGENGSSGDGSRTGAENHGGAENDGSGRGRDAGEGREQAEGGAGDRNHVAGTAGNGGVGTQENTSSRSLQLRSPRNLARMDRPSTSGESTCFGDNSKGPQSAIGRNLRRVGFLEASKASTSADTKEETHIQERVIYGRSYAYYMRLKRQNNVMLVSPGNSYLPGNANPPNSPSIVALN